MIEKDSSQATALLEEPLDLSQSPTQEHREVKVAQSVVEQIEEKREPEVDKGRTLPERPKRGPVKRAITALLIVAVLGVGYLYREEIVKLIPVQNGESTTSNEQTATAGERKILYWHDPMHPAYKSDKPGTAPDCGMDLEPVYADETTAGQISANLPEGVFKISPEKQQLIGVQYGTVTYQPVAKTLRTVGRLAYDETKIVRVHTRIDGWIENVFADFTGKHVSKGEPLIGIYSPDLLQTQQEFLLAIRGRAELQDTAFREAVTGAESLYQSARRRLQLWEITDEQIDEIEKRGSPIKTMTIYAPSEGFILARNAYSKQRVTPETELYSIADLSTIWVLAEIYEYEIPEIRLGQRADVTLSYFPGRTYRGNVTYIYPQVDNTTRTLKVRIEIPNQNFELKPDMYANVELKIDYGKRLIVPQEAVMDSGAEQMVFIALEDGYFEPRKIKLGGRVDNKTIVLEGLKEGERVVTSANFLIDSESKLQSGMASSVSHDHGESTTKQKPVQNSDQKMLPAADKSIDHKNDHKPEKKKEQINDSSQKKDGEHSCH
jgi:membrane fusion protein, copper/silver efflux system